MILLEAFRYALKGGLLTLLNVAGMMLLVEIAAMPPEIAAIVSTLALVLVGYQLMNRFVFPDTAGPSSTPRRLGAYYAVILSGKGVNYVLFVGLLSIGVWYPLAWIIGSVTVFVGTFTANRFVWNQTAA